MHLPTEMNPLFVRPSRRTFLSLATAAVAGIAAGRALGQAQKARSPFVQQSLDQAAQAKLESKMLRGDVGVVSGAGGNVGVLKAPAGALAVDSSYSTAAAHLWEQLNALGVDKVPHLINTHWHLDHTDGNAALHQRGARILAHERTRYWMSRDHVIAVPGAFEASIPAAPAGGLPEDVMTERRTVHHGAETIELTHYPAAHTDSDIAVVFTKANVVHTGDLFFNGFYPLVDSTTGGKLFGVVDAGHKILASTDAETIFIPGHGPVATRQDYLEFLTMMNTVGQNVQKLKRAGKTADEAVQEHPTQAFDAKWGKGLLTPEKFTRVVYAAI